MHKERSVKAAHRAALGDERVARALTEENGYWQSDEVRLKVIQTRCADAGHYVYRPVHPKKRLRKKED